MFGESVVGICVTCREWWEGWGRRRLPALWGALVKDRYSGDMVEIGNANIQLGLVRKIIFTSVCGV